MDTEVHSSVMIEKALQYLIEYSDNVVRVFAVLR